MKINGKYMVITVFFILLYTLYGFECFQDIELGKNI